MKVHTVSTIGVASLWMRASCIEKNDTEDKEFQNETNSAPDAREGGDGTGVGADVDFDPE